MKTYPDIAYSAHLDDMRRADIFAPDSGARATVLWLHGGGIEAGSRKGFEGVASQLCAEGIAFVSAEYRMYPSARYPQFIEDGAEAAAWLLKNAARFGLSGKIFVGGSSAGAYLAMMICFARGYLARFGAMPENFAGFIFDAGQPTTHFNVLRYRGEDSRRCVVDEAAPLYHIDGARPNRPLKIIYADRDMPARLEQNQLLAATLRHWGYDMSLVDVELMTGYGHCGYDGAMSDGRWILADLIGRFVRRALG